MGWFKGLADLKHAVKRFPCRTHLCDLERSVTVNFQRYLALVTVCR